MIDDIFGEPIRYNSEWDDITIEDIENYFNSLPESYWKKVNAWLRNPLSEFDNE